MIFNTEVMVLDGHSSGLEGLFQLKKSSHSSNYGINSAYKSNIKCLTQLSANNTSWYPSTTIATTKVILVPWISKVNGK